MRNCNDIKCPINKICNPESIRCVLRSGRIGKKLLTASKRSKKSQSRKSSTCKPKQKLVNGNCECISPLQILNKYTKNCVARNGVIGKKILNGTHCPKDQIYSLDKKQCVNKPDSRSLLGASHSSPKLPDIAVSPSKSWEKIKFKPSTRPCITDSLTKLAPYQALTVDYFMSSTDSLLAVFDTGMGKTLTALAIAECYIRKNPTSKIVIITQKSLLGTFKKEFAKYGPVHEDKYEVYTYDRVLLGEKKGEPLSGRNALVIIDEVHTLRNYLSHKFFACMNMVRKAAKVLLLTATPIVNNICDFIPIINLLNKKYIIGPYCRNSEKCNDPSIPILYAKPKYFIRGCAKRIDLQITNQLAFETIKGLLNGKVSYAQKSTGHGTHYPAVQIHDELIGMNPSFEEQFKFAVSDTSNIFAAPEKFANGYRRAVNTLGSEYFSEKLDRVIEIIRRDKSKYAKNVIFSNWIEYGVETIKTLLDNEGIEYGVITGDTSAKERQAAVSDFNKPDGITTLIISGAGSTGLDLKGVQNIIVLDPVWNNALLEQIKGRGVRYKSHEHLPPALRTVNIYLLKLVEKAFINGKTDRCFSGDYLLYNTINIKAKAEKVVSEMLKEVSILHRFAGFLDYYE
jgi:superfamily II DNA or RNA helicase